MYTIFPFSSVFVHPAKSETFGQFNMTTVPVPPPPPPPPPQPPKKCNPPPCPQHAAIPIRPVQETTHSTEALHNSQDEAAPLQALVHNGPPAPSQGQDDLEDEGKKKPVQETDPAPQTLSSSQNFEIAQPTVQEDNPTNSDETEEN